MVQQSSYWKVLTRRKQLQADGTEGESKLNRVLGLWDLTALGVGSTLGAGVYVLAGQIAKEQAGPSVMLSFAIAALASLLAGICYAEFGARVPKAGSAYVYSYVCIGEFAAFVIGWNLILEYVIGAASVCRGISLYLDSLLNDTLKQTFAEVAPMNVSFLGSYFDFLAFGLVIIFGVALAFGVETSTMANNFVTCVNIFILLFVIIAGAIKADFSNWVVNPATANATNIGNGGYFPYGIEGTLKGAATCFFGFVGFDCIATTGEEVRNPRKNIPRSILLSLLIIFLCYFGVSTVLTLMLPYYQQDANAPLPYAFEYVGWPVAMWIVTLGGLIGLLASLFGALFPLPRVIYSMAQDGLLFRFLGKVSPRFQVPVTGSIVAALFTALIAGVFDLAQLVSLLSIGTLLAYSVVAVSITILRYMEYNAEQPQQLLATETTSLTSSSEKYTCGFVCAQLFNVHRLAQPNTISTRIVGVLTTVFCLLSLGVGLLVMQAYPAISSGQPWALTVLILLLLGIVMALLLICLQPREAYTRLFRVPFVPVVPAISIFINIYLMLQLDSWTWIRFGIWMILGVPIFIACWCLYDLKNPQHRNAERSEFLKELKAQPVLPLSMPNGGTLAGSTTTQETHVKRSNSSIDLIQNLSDVSDELKEIKNANGKVFYVEDTKSSSSTASLGGLEAQQDEEQSVIAMLDDVLDAEDTQQQRLEQLQIYGRHFSMDSEMYPSVIETTIVATVHSSSSDDDEDGSQQSARYDECKLAASKMLTDMFESETFFEQLQAAKQRMEQRTNSKPAMAATTPPIPIIKRVASVTSLESQTSIAEDPMRSEKFKNRLSHIMLNANPHKVAAKRQQEEQAPNQLEKPSRPSLKHSKSESDVRILMLKAMNELKRVKDDDGDDVTAAEATPAAQTNLVPRAPKFDPVLYKTINSISLQKRRPSLSKELAPPLVDAKNTELEAAIEQSSLEPLPFKAKLEAILKRGPSHRTQQRPDAVVVQRRRPQSAYIAEPYE